MCWLYNVRPIAQYVFPIYSVVMTEKFGRSHSETIPFGRHAQRNKRQGQGGGRQEPQA